MEFGGSPDESMVEEIAQYGAYRADSIYIKDTQQLLKNPDIRKFEVYQNQRVWMGIFKDAVFPHERPVWSDESGKIKIKKENILLPPEGGWKWQSNWIVEIDESFHDKKGWSYAYDFNGPYKKTKGLLDFVRRRKWVRVAASTKLSAQNL